LKSAELKFNKWSIVDSSVIGFSHENRHIQKQDYADCYIDDINGYIIMAVSDGHGSSRYFRSDRGSRFAVMASMIILKEYFRYYRSPKIKNQEDEPGELKQLSRYYRSPETKDREDELGGLKQLSSKIVFEWYNLVKKDFESEPFSPKETKNLSKKEEAKANKSFITAYGATLLCTIITDNFIYFIQLGDGDVTVIEKSGKSYSLFPKDKYHFANETSSLCTPKSFTEFKFDCLDIRNDSSFKNSPALIMLSTDGYSNSFSENDGILKAGMDILKAAFNHGPSLVEEKIENWLSITSKNGSGDDISAAIAFCDNTIEEIRSETPSLLLEKEHQQEKCNQIDFEVVKNDFSRSISALVEKHGPREVYNASKLEALLLDYFPGRSNRKYVKMLVEIIRKLETCAHKFLDSDRDNGEMKSRLLYKWHDETEEEIDRALELFSILQAACAPVLCRVVSKNGKWDDTNISDALSRIIPGGRILVSPGIYNEVINISKPVEIIGIKSNNGERAVIEGIVKCIEISSENVILKNIDFRVKDGYYGCVYVKKSTRIEECTMTSSADINFYISGKGTEAQVIKCKIIGGVNCVEVSNGADLYLTECEISGEENKTTGIKISGNSKLYLKKSIIHKHNYGIAIKNGYLTSNDCEIFNCSKHGINIINGRCDLNMSSIHDCDSGLFIFDDANIDITNSKIYNNTNYGISLHKTDLNNSSSDIKNITLNIKSSSITGHGQCALSFNNFNHTFIEIDTDCDLLTNNREGDCKQHLKKYLKYS